MLKEQISLHLPHTHPIIVSWNNISQNGRRIAQKVHGYMEGCENHLISKRRISVQIGNLGLNLNMPIDLLDSFDE